MHTAGAAQVLSGAVVQRRALQPCIIGTLEDHSHKLKMYFYFDDVGMSILKSESFHCRRDDWTAPCVRG